jgi:hypothetical protein
MKCPLLFYQHQQPGRLESLPFISTAICLSGTCGNKSLSAAKEYVPLANESPKEKVKNLLFNDPENKGQFPCQKQGVLNDRYRHFLMVFNADIQQLTVGKAIVFPWSFSTPNSSFTCSRGRCSCLLINSVTYPINVKTYEHFYRLRSLFGHAPQSVRTLKKAKMEGGLFWNNKISKLPI